MIENTKPDIENACFSVVFKEDKRIISVNYLYYILIYLAGFGFICGYIIFHLIKYLRI